MRTIGYIGLALTLVLGHLGAAQTTPPPTSDPSITLSKEQARQDVTALRAILEEAHPGLYR
jgi:hypothetical protein